MGGRNARPDRPRAPGWYPDPWSATGDGERYFDGERWGSTERPLGRQTTVLVDERPSRRARVRRVHPAVALIALVVTLAGVRTLGGGGEGDVRLSGLFPPASGPRGAVPLGAPPKVADRPGGYEFLKRQPDDHAMPVAFDPCRPIHYVVNPTGQPSDGLSLIQDAVAQVEAATGLRFVYDGATSEREAPKYRRSYQPRRYARTRWAPVLITWSDEAHVPRLAGDVTGLGGPLSMPIGRKEPQAYVTGSIVLDRHDLSEVFEPNRLEVRATVLHELGHLVGLDHTSDPTQLMFPRPAPGVLDFADGDRRGLARLGSGRCFPGL